MKNLNSLPAIQSSAFNFVRPFMSKILKNETSLASIVDYNLFLQQSAHPIISASGFPIKAIGQEGGSKSFLDNYEASIYLRGELRTRENNWHDFFNLLMWYVFPKTKAIINKWQYLKLTQRAKNTRRTHVENLLTQLDEGGLIVFSSNRELINLIYQRRWLKLFWHYRNLLKDEIQFFLIGHAIYEKMLNPWLGISAPALLFEVDAGFIQQDNNEKLILLDERCAKYLDNDTWHLSMPKLLSFPILGIPGWYENTEEKFYENKSYFWSGSADN